MITGHVWSTQHGVARTDIPVYSISEAIWAIHLSVEHTKASLKQLRGDVLPERPPTVLNFTHRPLILKFKAEREDVDSWLITSKLRVRPRLILSINAERHTVTNEPLQ